MLNAAAYNAYGKIVHKTYACHNVEKLLFVVDEDFSDSAETHLIDTANWLEVAPAHVHDKDDFLACSLLERLEHPRAFSVGFETIFVQNDHFFFTDDPWDHPKKSDTTDSCQYDAN